MEQVPKPRPTAGTPPLFIAEPTAPPRTRYWLLGRQAVLRPAAAHAALPKIGAFYDAEFAGEAALLRSLHSTHGGGGKAEGKGTRPAGRTPSPPCARHRILAG